jgi:hypothetical protein
MATLNFEVEINKLPQPKGINPLIHKGIREIEL